MADDTKAWPRILSRSTQRISPWMNVIAREVEFTPGAKPEIYHAVGQLDYMAILAVAPDGRIPLVWQYRPAIEAFSWELPAGLVEAEESAADGCRRELMEETGFPTRAIHDLGINAACTGRMSNRIHSFFVEAGERVAGFVEEPGVHVRMVTPAELVTMIRDGEFVQQMHLGTLMQAQLAGLLVLPH